jgi:helicase
MVASIPCLQSPQQKTSIRESSSVQQEILDSGLLTSGFNCILQMPTGSGKTWLAEQAIAHTLNQGTRAIYLTPLRALADELQSRWQTHFAPQLVGVFTGDYTTYPVPYQNARLLVMTPEKLDACTRNWRSHWSWLPEVTLIVVDEFHLLGDSRRGGRLESTLLRLIRLNPFVRVLGLSATLGNRQELAEWLSGVEYSSSIRPIPLEWKTMRYKRAGDKPDLLLQELQRNLATGGKSLVFVQSRRRAEGLANWLVEAGLQAAHHHAGLNHKKRHQVEAQFRGSNLDVLVATATLEMGLNLPVRQVVLYDLQGFDGTDFVPLAVNNVWQRAGRAGRPGLDAMGEVVLLSPVWEGRSDHYAKGQFEAIRSGLNHSTALAEQIVAEVASGLCRTHTQLTRVFSRTLAAHQGILPSVSQVTLEMIEAGMLVERQVDDDISLRATGLGFVAVRHLLSPRTILQFQKCLQSRLDLTFLDLLILAASTDDCQPLVPVDFEQLDELADILSHEPSMLLGRSEKDLSVLLGIGGKRLLAAIHTALIARTWTRLGDVEQVAEARGCYAFEVECLREAMDRLLLSMEAVLTLLEPSKLEPEMISLTERIHALQRMMMNGLDEVTVTLTLIRGIGAKLAMRLREVGVMDIEDLALADEDAIAQVPGISLKRARQWIEQAGDLVDCHSSAHRYREEPTDHRVTAPDFPSDVDPYRLRRALDLRVVGWDGDRFRVTGGLDPHTVICRAGAYRCDCADFAKDKLCKHILAIRLHRGDTQLRRLTQMLTMDSEQSGLDLLQLWMASS